MWLLFSKILFTKSRYRPVPPGKEMILKITFSKDHSDVRDAPLKVGTVENRELDRVR